MSLINQALKLEQQRRHTDSRPLPPIVSQAMARRGRGSNLTTLLIGFTGLGMVLAMAAGAFFYFGAQYLDDPSKSLAADSEQKAETVPEVQSTENQPEPTQSDAIETLLGALTKEQISTVQQMLLEKQEQSTPQAEPSRPQFSVEERVRMQDRVDSFSVQGIRKSGASSRVFLNGKIVRIGDVVDIEFNLRLVGFDETHLIFEDPAGNRYPTTY